MGCAQALSIRECYVCKNGYFPSSTPTLVALQRADQKASGAALVFVGEGRGLLSCFSSCCSSPPTLHSTEEVILGTSRHPPGGRVLPSVPATASLMAQPGCPDLFEAVLTAFFVSVWYSQQPGT